MYGSSWRKAFSMSARSFGTGGVISPRKLDNCTINDSTSPAVSSLSILRCSF